MISNLTIYIGIALGIIFQGEVALLGAGHLIYTGAVKFWNVALIATFLSTINGEIFFTLSKFGSKFILSDPKNLKEKLAKATNLMNRYKTFLLLFSRFVYGLRNLIPVAFGLSNITHFEFSILNFAGALIWAITFTSLGVISGNVVSNFIDLQRHQMMIFGIFLGIAFTIMMLKITKKGEQRNEAR
jgi:membrane protein DedA with SNARE-associated domain